MNLYKVHIKRLGMVNILANSVSSMFKKAAKRGSGIVVSYTEYKRSK